MNERHVFRPSWLSLIPHFILIGLIVGIYTFPRQLLRILTTKIEVEDGMVYGKVGIFNKSTQNSPISRIQSVRVDRSFWSRIFGYGDVKITTAGDGYVYKGIANPEKVRNVITSYM